MEENEALRRVETALWHGAKSAIEALDEEIDKLAIDGTVDVEILHEALKLLARAFQHGEAILPVTNELLGRTVETDLLEDR